MSGPKPATLSVQPLLDAVRVHSSEGKAHARSEIAQLAELLGLTSKTIHRWKHHNVQHDAADKAAIALGLHPVELWPDFHDT